MTGGNARPVGQVLGVVHVVQVPGIIEHPALRGNVGVHDLLQLLGGDGGRGHLERRVEGGEVDLEAVLVPPVQHHGLEPVTPEYLVRQIGAARLELGVTGLVGSLQHRHQLKLLLGQLGGRDVVEGGVLVDHVDDLQRPDKEDTALVALVWGNIECLHFLSYLAFKANVSLQQLQGYLKI